MSFALTTPQFKARTKTVTRRMGWQFLKPGDLVRGVKKAMGLKKGEKIEALGVIRVVKVSRERLETITKEDVVKEGFPRWKPSQFIYFLVEHYKIKPETVFTRIEFEYVRHRADAGKGGRMRADESKLEREKQEDRLKVFLKKLTPGDFILGADWYRIIKELGLGRSDRQRLTDLRQKEGLVMDWDRAKGGFLYEGFQESGQLSLLPAEKKAPDFSLHRH